MTYFWVIITGLFTGLFWMALTGHFWMALTGHFWVIMTCLMTCLMIWLLGVAGMYALKKPQLPRMINATIDIVCFAIVAPIAVGLIMKLVL